MKYQISNKGFATETLTISVMPNECSAEHTTIEVLSSLVEDDESYPGSGCYPSNSFMKEGQNDFTWPKDGDSYVGVFQYKVVKATEVEEFLKKLAAEFYAFHKAQDEAANLTIETIRSLRVENLVPEMGWEVVKTTSRRGSARIRA